MVDSAAFSLDKTHKLKLGSRAVAEFGSVLTYTVSGHMLNQPWRQSSRERELSDWVFCPSEAVISSMQLFFFFFLTTFSLPSPQADNGAAEPWCLWCFLQHGRHVSSHEVKNLHTAMWVLWPQRVFKYIAADVMGTLWKKLCIVNRVLCSVLCTNRTVTYKTLNFRTD